LRFGADLVGDVEELHRHGARALELDVVRAGRKPDDATVSAYDPNHSADELALGVRLPSERTIVGVEDLPPGRQGLDFVESVARGGERLLVGVDDVIAENDESSEHSALGQHMKEPMPRRQSRQLAGILERERGNGRQLLEQLKRFAPRTGAVARVVDRHLTGDPALPPERDQQGVVGLPRSDAEKPASAGDLDPRRRQATTLREEVGITDAVRVAVALSGDPLGPREKVEKLTLLAFIQPPAGVLENRRLRLGGAGEQSDAIHRRQHTLERGSPLDSLCGVLKDLLDDVRLAVDLFLPARGRCSHDRSVRRSDLSVNPLCCQKATSCDACLLRLRRETFPCAFGEGIL
jgi:hypothetical protein